MNGSEKVIELQVNSRELSDLISGLYSLRKTWPKELIGRCEALAIRLFNAGIAQCERNEKEQAA